MCNIITSSKSSTPCNYFDNLEFERKSGWILGKIQPPVLTTDLNFFWFGKLSSLATKTDPSNTTKTKLLKDQHQASSLEVLVGRSYLGVSRL